MLRERDEYDDVGSGDDFGRRDDGEVVSRDLDHVYRVGYEVVRLVLSPSFGEIGLYDPHLLSAFAWGRLKSRSQIQQCAIEQHRAEGWSGFLVLDRSVLMVWYPGFPFPVSGP